MEETPFLGFPIRLYSGNTQSPRRESFECEVFVQLSHFTPNYVRSAGSEGTEHATVLRRGKRHYISATLRFN